MEIVYMGIISKIFNAIFNAILSPVFKFISSLLETALSWLFDTILKPLLINVLKPMFTALLELIFDILAGIIYSIYADVLKFVDSLQSAFNVFAGLQKVTYNGRDSTLLDVVFRLPQIQTALWVLISISFALMLLFAILGTLRSMADLENQRPISKVLSATCQSFLKMLLIPAVSLFAIAMAGQILVGIDSALGGSQTSLARTVFVVSSLDACNNSDFNISTPGEGITPGVSDDVREHYYSGEYSYTNKSQVEKDFKFGDFDYLIGFGGAIFLVVVLGACLLTFISRIFEVVVLLLVSPVFASVMPLDDGEKFKGWQDMFVAKLFGGYGTVMAMQIYMQLCPAVMDGNIIFGQGSTEANYLIRLIFLLGGAWSVIKAGPAITQLLNYQAGAAEAENNRAVTTAMAATASFAGASVAAAGRTAAQKYKGWRVRKNEALAESDKRISNRLGFETDENGKRTGRTLKEAQAAAAGAGASGTVGGSGGSGGKANLPPTGKAGGVTGSSITNTGGAGGRNKVGKGLGQAQRTGSYFSGHITTNKSKGGHSYLGVDFGKALRFGRNADGTFSGSFLGIGYRVGQDGKLDKVSLPFVRVKKYDDGKMHVARYKIPLTGIRNKRMESVTTRPDGTKERKMVHGGQFYTSDNFFGRQKARYDQETGRVEKLRDRGNYFQKNADGKYVLTHSTKGGVRREYERGEDGSYRETNRVGNLTESSYSYDENGKRQTDSLTSMKNRIQNADGSRPRQNKYIFKRDTTEGGEQS